MRLAARGARNLDQGEEPITDALAAGVVRRQAHRVHIQSVLVALVLTVFCLAIPG